MTRRVLVARLDSMGDVLVCGPAVRAIAHDSGRQAEVWMLVSPQGEAAARLLPGVARVLVWSCPWITTPTPEVTPESVADLQSLVARANPDEAVILTSFHQSPLPLALLLQLAGVRRITGASVDFAGTLLETRLRPGEDFDENQPEPLRALRIAAAAGFSLDPADDGLLSVRVSGNARERADSLLRPLDDKPFVVLHPRAAVPAREWPLEHFRRAAELLHEHGVAVVVTGSRSETGSTAAVAGATALDLGDRLDLDTLAAVLQRADALVAGNTGPAHLAAAVGTPVVSLFSPVVPAMKWAPYGVPVRLLGDQSAECRLTRAQACPVAGHPCLADVTPDAVVDACLEFAGRRMPVGRAR